MDVRIGVDVLVRVVMVGPGRVGLALTLALQATGNTVLGAVARNPGSASSHRFADATQTPVRPLPDIRIAPDAPSAVVADRVPADPVAPDQATPRDSAKAAADMVSSADVVFVTTPDHAIAETAARLAEHRWLRAGQVVVHTAGSQGSHILTPAKAAGARILSLHPLQTFADPLNGPSLLRGAWCTLEGDAEAVDLGRQLVSAWGGHPVELSPALRPQYHAAAVLASNAVVSLAGLAAELSSLPDGLDALLPLIRAAVDNLASVGLPDALTGPVERGDANTVQAHLEALQSNPTAFQVYAALGRSTAKLALEKGSLSEAQYQAFDELFCDALKRGPSPSHTD